MPEALKPRVILLADDDLDDRLFIRRALEENLAGLTIKEVEDGEELTAYLRREEPYRDSGVSPRPTLILLDLNMPRKSGLDALQEIKTDPALRKIPVVALTTSRVEEDVLRSYDLGVNAFITKPLTLEDMNHAMKIVRAFWFETAQTPDDG